MARVQLIRAALVAAFLASPAYAQLGPRPVGPQVNAQNGVTYTVVNSDCGKLVTFSNGSPVAVTLPQAGAASAFAAGCEIRFANRGAGTVTVTPTVSTVDGQSSVAIASGGGFTVNSSGGQWYSYGRGGASSGTVTSVSAGAGMDFSTITATGSVAASANTRTTGIVFIIDGGGSAITTGIKGDLEIPFACTITAARVLADQSGSIVVDIWKDTYANFPPTDADSITASAPPTISSATKAEDTTLTGWTTSISAGNILRFNVDSATTVTRVTVSLTCLKS